jgi:hypothetical protein
MKFLTGTHIPFDCEFLVAQRSAGEDENVEVYLTEVYHIHPRLSLQEHRVANWTHVSGIVWFIGPINHRRRNLQGITIKAAFREQVTSLMIAMLVCSS